jgi:hypothetical protein
MTLAGQPHLNIRTRAGRANAMFNACVLELLQKASRYTQQTLCELADQKQPPVLVQQIGLLLSLGGV